MITCPANPLGLGEYDMGEKKPQSQYNKYNIRIITGYMSKGTVCTMKTRMALLYVTETSVGFHFEAGLAVILDNFAISPPGGILPRYKTSVVGAHV